MKVYTLVVVLSLVSLSCGTVLFNGNFNQYATRTDFDKWSFANQADWPYQTYIYGAGFVMSSFVDLSKNYRAPIDSTANQGIRVAINGSSHWNGPMERTELVARLDQTTVFSGTKYFHFSLAQDPTFTLNAAYEHQIMFFEDHFADLKLGGTFGAQLNFVTKDQKSQWKIDFGTNVWHNFAIQVDFAGGQVGLYHSTGTAALTQVVPLTKSSPSTSEWHIGMLRLPGSTDSPTNEFMYVSSVYVSDALMTFTPVAAAATGPSQTASGSSSSAGSSSGGGGSSPTNPPVPSGLCNFGAANCYCTKGGTCDGGLKCYQSVWVCASSASIISTSFVVAFVFLFVALLF